jgi:hypothetical protein
VDLASHVPIPIKDVADRGSFLQTAVIDVPTRAIEILGKRVNNHSKEFVNLLVSVDFDLLNN